MRPLSIIFSMPDTIVVKALLDKGAEMRGQIAVLDGRLAKCRAELAHVQATLRLFDPAQDVKHVRPKAPAPPRSTYFAMGEITRRCRDALREATGPIAAMDIAVTAMRDKGLDPADRAIRSDMIRRLLWTLHRLATEGQIERLGQGLGARWVLGGSIGTAIKIPS